MDDLRDAPSSAEMAAKVSAGKTANGSCTCVEVGRREEGAPGEGARGYACDGAGEWLAGARGRAADWRTLRYSLMLEKSAGLGAASR